MPEQVKIIQRRLLVLNQRVLENAERKWSACTGIGGRHEPELVVGMARITHSGSCRLCRYQWKSDFLLQVIVLSWYRL